LRITLAVAFGRTVTRHRKKIELSQMKLAEAAGLHLNAVGMIERGERLPSLYTIVALARALRIPPQQLVAETLVQNPVLEK
jgi:transcriptional regulator with XRE-family HTH domain